MNRADGRRRPQVKTTPKPSFTRVRTGFLQRKCACGGSSGLDGACAACHHKQLGLQRRSVNQTELRAVPPIVHDVLRSPGQPLDLAARAFMEPRFGHDFSQVRVHSDARAAESARAVNALAYTVGRDIVVSPGAFRPETTAGRRLLAHELTHTIQQGAVGQSTLAAGATLRTTPATDQAEREAELAAADVALGWHTTMAPSAQSAPVLQRQTFRTPPVSVRSPVLEEAATQLTEFEEGRPLTRGERELARGVFGASIDYSRTRLIPTSILEYRTVANSIRVPENFTIANEEMAQTFIHEMTHVWQYQHGGTGYISISLGTQIGAQVRRGNRNFAYDYRINPGQSFFDFTPEQQAFLVENYFAMLRDQTAIPRDQAAGVAGTYESNHLDASGFRAGLSASDRLAEISRELPLHEPLIRQMRAALPRRERDILMLRAAEVMQTPGRESAPVPREQQLVPVKPLLEIRFSRF
jgi:hypothetical protein